MHADHGSVTICIVESDESVRRSLARLVHSHGFKTLTFEDVDQLLASPELGEAGCVISDVLASGAAVTLVEGLRARGLGLPVILQMADESDSLRARAQKAGVAACFLKPVDGQALADAIDWALSAPRSDEFVRQENRGGRP